MPDTGNFERQSSLNNHNDKIYLVDRLNETERNSLSRDQYEILKLIEDVSPQSSRASIIRQVFQCIRGLSLIRCVGIFVWPMITENLLPQLPLASLPSLPSIPLLPFAANQRKQARQNSRSFEKFYESFGLSADELQDELIDRKNLIEDNLLGWYETISDSKYSVDFGPLKLKNNGHREIGISMSEYREGRGHSLKDEKSIMKMLNAINKLIEDILNTKSEKFKQKKRSRDSRHSRLEDPRKLYLKDEEVINLLIDKIRSTDNFQDDNDSDDRKLTLDDAYNAFQLLFGPKYEHDSIDNSHEDPHFIFPLEAQKNNEKLSKKTTITSTDRLSKSRSLNSNNNNNNNNNVKKFNLREEKYSLKNLLADYIKKRLYSNRKKLQTGLIVRLPRLDDKISSRKVTSALTSVGRGMKSKLQAAAPAIGLLMSFIIQMSLAHAKAASTVAEMLSNMALAGATMSMLRDMVFGGQDKTQIKYVYDQNEKFDTDMQWPMPVHDEPDPAAFMHKPF